MREEPLPKVWDMEDERRTTTLLTAEEIAAILKVRKHRVYELARTGVLPVVRVGRQLRFDEHRFQDWIRNGGRSLSGGWKRSA